MGSSSKKLGYPRGVNAVLCLVLFRVENCRIGTAIEPFLKFESLHPLGTRVGSLMIMLKCVEAFLQLK